MPPPHGSVLLGHLIHLAHRLADLFQRRFLLMRGGDDRGNTVVDLQHVILMPLKVSPVSRTRRTPASTSCAEREINALISRAAVADRWASSRTSWANHRKAPAAFACPCRLDTRIQGEKVGLEGNLVDHTDDLSDLP